MNKTCSKCKETKTIDSFTKNKSQKDGLSHYCRSCKRAHDAKYVEKNKQILREKYKEFYKKNKHKYKKYSELNKEKIKIRRKNQPSLQASYTKEYQRKYRELNKYKRTAWENKRRSAKLKATPLWANDFFIEEIYHLAQLRTKITGFLWHVDHIVPLQGKNVCGLHCEFNLQVIPAKENLKKSNNFN